MTLVRTWSGRETRALRGALRMSVRDFAAYLGVSSRTVAKWEARGIAIQPRPEIQAVLDTALSRADENDRARFVLIMEEAQATSALCDHIGRAATVADGERNAPLRATETTVSWRDSPEVNVRDEQEVSSLPTRRGMIGYFGAGLMAAGATRHSSTSRVLHALAITRQADIADVHDATLEDLNTLVEHYKQTFRSTPPAEFYDEVLGVRAHAGLLLKAMTSRNQLSDLTIVLGWLSNLLALVTHDLGDRAAALVWCADAERRGREAGEPELAGWAYLTRVRMSFYDGQVDEAVTNARRGQGFARLGTVAHAELLAQEMRAWAIHGGTQADMVFATRRRAEHAIGRLPAIPPTSGAFSINLTDDPPYTGTSLLLIGRYRESAEATKRVIARFYGPNGCDGPSGHPSGFARAHLVLGLATAGLGELDEAAAAGRMALDAPRPVWPTAVLARRLDRILTRDFAGTAEARDYHERYMQSQNMTRATLLAGERPVSLSLVPHSRSPNRR